MTMSRLTDAIRNAGSTLRTDEDGFEKEFVFNAEFIGFDGHFPGNPILPAMVQIMTGAETAREAAGKSMAPHTVTRAKFVRPIHPDERLVVKGVLKNRKGATVAPVTIEVDGEAAAIFTVTFSEGNDE